MLSKFAVLTGLLLLGCPSPKVPASKSKLTKGEVEGEQALGSDQFELCQLADLASRKSSEGDPPDEWWQEVSLRAEALCYSWRDAGRPTLPPSYVASIQGHIEMLKSASETPDAAPPARHEMVQSAIADLDLKLSYAGGEDGVHNIGSPQAAPFYTRVLVTVHTKNSDGKARGGLYIRAHPWIFRGDQSDPLVVFNNATTPSTAKVPPGKYSMWVQTPEEKILFETSVDIGLEGAEQEIVLQIPEWN